MLASLAAVPKKVVLGVAALFAFFVGVFLLSRPDGGSSSSSSSSSSGAAKLFGGGGVSPKSASCRKWWHNLSPDVVRYSKRARNTRIAALRNYIYERSFSADGKLSGPQQDYSAEQEKDQGSVDSLCALEDCRTPECLNSFHWARSRTPEGAREWKNGFRKYAAELKLESAEVVMEMGSGAGAPLSFFAEEYPSLGVFSTDFYEVYTAVDRMNPITGHGAWATIDGTRAGAYDFIPDDFMDAIFSYGSAFGYDPDIKKQHAQLGAAIRMLRPGGRLVIGCISDPEHGAKGVYHTEIPKTWWKERESVFGFKVLKLQTDLEMTGMKRHYAAERYTVVLQKNDANKA